MHLSICTYVFLWVRVCVCLCVCVCVCVCLYVSMAICECVCVYMYTCVSVGLCVCGAEEACVCCREDQVSIQFRMGELTLGLESWGNPLSEPQQTPLITSSWNFQGLSRRVRERGSRRGSLGTMDF